VENVEENMAQRNVTVGHFNAYAARIHMKHGAKSVLNGSLRSIDLRNSKITFSISSLPISTLFSFILPRARLPRSL
jgi:hypothetical protein